MYKVYKGIIVGLRFSTNIAKLNLEGRGCGLYANFVYSYTLTIIVILLVLVDAPNYLLFFF